MNQRSSSDGPVEEPERLPDHGQPRSGWDSSVDEVRGTASAEVRRQRHPSRYFQYWEAAVDELAQSVTKTVPPVEPGRRRRPRNTFAGARPGALIDGTYRVHELLGEGGMGMVVRARDEHLERDVAVKLIHPRCITDDGVRERFLAEARVMARIRNPSVVEIYSYGEYERAPYLVMEFVPGRSLDDWLLQCDGQPLAVDEAIGILDQVCQGVAAMHRAGAVHHDLKPSNILIGPAFRVAVADLGLAWIVDDASDKARPVAGTPAYMAPEIARGARVPPALAARADIYSLGVIAFELFTGQLPFEGNHAEEVMRMQIERQPMAPSEIEPSLAPSFDRAILDALTKDPAQRTATATQLRDALLEARSQSRAEFSDVCILVVDDQAEFREWLARTLRLEFPGCEIRFAKDGAEGLEILTDTPMSLVITDLRMPTMNGMELTAAIRGQEKTRHVPIVVLTGVGGASDWHILRRIGADGFLVKPVETASLRALVRRLLGANLAPQTVRVG
ncbi:MAG: hypothetical protein Tsb0020_07210 [Haliangiales bacterium]